MCIIPIQSLCALKPPRITYFMVPPDVTGLLSYKIHSENTSVSCQKQFAIMHLRHEKNLLETLQAELLILRVCTVDALTSHCLPLKFKAKQTQIPSFIVIFGVPFENHELHGRITDIKQRQSVRLVLLKRNLITGSYYYFYIRTTWSFEEVSTSTSLSPLLPPWNFGNGREESFTTKFPSTFSLFILYQDMQSPFINFVGINDSFFVQ